MKKDFTIVIIKILKWITLFALTIFTIGFTLSLFNNEPYSDFLRSINMYSAYQNVSNSIISIIILLIFGMSYLIIPYIVISFWLAVVFLVKYIQKKRNIIKPILLTISLILLLFVILKTLLFSDDYIVKVNSKVDQISNIEISEYIKKNITGNPYIRYIGISKDFFGYYNIEINYFDKWFTSKKASASYNDEKLLFDNAKKITNQKDIIIIILLIITIILYIYFCKYIIKEYYQLTGNEIEGSRNSEKHNLITNYSLIALLILTFLFITITNYINNSNEKIMVLENKDVKSVEQTYL